MGFQREDALKALTANQNNFDNALGKTTIVQCAPYNLNRGYQG